MADPKVFPIIHLVNMLSMRMSVLEEMFLDTSEKKAEAKTRLENRIKALEENIKKQEIREKLKL